ncbi:MAG: zinc ribbon domain-containing protein [Bryobacteraceae bacterium]
MADFCSCGAELPPDAVFCHKCGKPQRELIEVAAEEPSPTPVVPPPEPQRPPMPLDFRNPLALKIALLVAMGATALFFLPYVNWLAAGYFAVFLYRRRTGCVINVGAGVRLGWITGLFTFPLAGVFYAAVFYVIKEATAMPQFRADPRFQELVGLMRSPSDIAALLLQLFILTTCLSMAGGALAAKLGQPSQPRGGSNA